MKYTEEERKQLAQTRIKKEQRRATNEKIVLWFELSIGIITLIFLILALSH